MSRCKNCGRFVADERECQWWHCERRHAEGKDWDGYPVTLLCSDRCAHLWDMFHPGTVVAP